MDFYVYIVECKDSTYYCGCTKDLDQRIFDHNQSLKGAKYTRNRRPVRLVYTERYDTKSQALKREIQIKNMGRKEKERLVLPNKG